MRIAVAIETDHALQSPVSGHFGHSPFSLLAEIEEGGVSSWRLESNPYLQHHEPGQIPEYINRLGAQALICGGMGRRAMSFFDQYGIKTAVLPQGSAEEAIRKFLAGELGEAEPCSGDHQGHGHGEHEHGAGCGEHH